MVIHYEEALYQVHTPSPLLFSFNNQLIPNLLHESDGETLGEVIGKSRVSRFVDSRGSCVCGRRRPTTASVK